MRFPLTIAAGVLALGTALAQPQHQAPTANGLPNPVLFVTQVPVKSDWANVTSAASNHKPDAKTAYRGGDLWILYPDGSRKNLTQAAGYGVEGLQWGPGAIAVRGPAVHWSATKAVFSMVVGTDSAARWQLYEVAGLGQGQTTTITKVAKQPAQYNNVDPVYGSDDRILFASDRPHNGAAHLWPQLDEYNSLRTVTGLWSLDTVSGSLRLLNHAPSGAYKPIVDSFGRVVFSRLDHLTRDKHPEVEVYANEDLGPYNYSGEGVGSVKTASIEEIFPGPNRQWVDYVNFTPGYSGPLFGYQSDLYGHYMQRFLPWTMFQDGTREETIQRIGEQELGDLGNTGGFNDYTLNPVFNDDSALSFIGYPFSIPTINPSPVRNVLQIREHPLLPGIYLGIDARYHDTHASGKLIAFWAHPILGAHQVVFLDLSHPTTANPYATKPAGHTGFYRSPLPMSDNSMLAVHTDDFRKEEDLPGTVFGAYQFRLKRIEYSGGQFFAGASLTGGIQEQLTLQFDAQQHPFNGELWELDPVEVVPRIAPYVFSSSVPAAELQVLSEEGVSLTSLQYYLRQNDAALIVSRNVTSREYVDRQQPYNLRVPGTSTQTIGGPGPVYSVSHLQLLEARMLRGYDGPHMYAESHGGRRVLAQPQTSVAGLNPPSGGGPAGSVKIGPDGSVAAIVPARRAMTWQLVDPQGEPVVRERYWMTFQPGEVRTCTSCHDPNLANQAIGPPPMNKPEALRTLLKDLKAKGAL